MSKGFTKTKRIVLENRALATFGLLEHLTSQKDKKLTATRNGDKIEGKYDANISYKIYFSDSELKWNIRLGQENKRSRQQVRRLESYFQSYNPNTS